MEGWGKICFPSPRAPTIAKEFMGCPETRSPRLAIITVPKAAALTAPQWDFDIDIGDLYPRIVGFARRLGKPDQMADLVHRKGSAIGDQVHVDEHDDRQFPTACFMADYR